MLHADRYPLSISDWSLTGWLSCETVLARFAIQRFGTVAQQMEDTSWITLSEAARLLGVSRTAVRQRVQRGTLPTMPDNHGRPLTRLPFDFATVRNTTVLNVTIETIAPESEPLQPVQQTAGGAPDMVPVAVMREVVAMLQAAHVADRQRHETELVRQEARHLANSPGSNAHTIRQPMC